MTTQSKRASRRRAVRQALVLAMGMGLTAAAQAHITYTGRDFGSISGAASLSIANQTVTGNYGWADATDADFGDSHKSRAYRFALTDTFDVTITAAANPSATAASLGGLLPGFSIYRGLAHLTGNKDHDFSDISQAYLATLPGIAKEGAWNALGDWKVGPDGAGGFDDLSFFDFVGYAVDGTVANFASGFQNGVVGDGMADGRVSMTFRLGPGDYSIFVGGADYDGQFGGTSAISPYGVSLALDVAPVPEPETYVLMLLGLGLTSLAARRDRPRRLAP